MKKLSLFLLAVLFTSGAFAQAGFDQTIIVFSSTNLPGEEGERSYEAECNAMIAFTGLALPDGAYIGEGDVAVKVMLQSIHTKKTNGVLKKPIKKIGEMLVCQDWTGVNPDNNVIPAFYGVTLKDGTRFIAEGGALSPFFGQLPGGGQVMAPQQFPIFYPAPGVLLLNTSATILPSLPECESETCNPLFVSDGSGGNMTINSIVNLAGDPRFETDGMGVIRLLEPIDDEYDDDDD
jgi:hypothetical protein